MVLALMLALTDTPAEEDGKSALGFDRSQPTCSTNSSDISASLARSSSPVRVLASNASLDLGAAYGTAKSGVGICSMGVLKPELLFKSTVPIIMAGILGIYGLIVSVILQGKGKHLALNPVQSVRPNTLKRMATSTSHPDFAADSRRS